MSLNKRALDDGKWSSELHYTTLSVHKKKTSGIKFDLDGVGRFSDLAPVPVQTSQPLN